jgi:hypothetical protein
MAPKPTQEELIAIVHKLRAMSELEAPDDEETELRRVDERFELLELLKYGTGCPHVMDLVYNAVPSLTPEEVVSKALEYRPIIL